MKYKHLYFTRLCSTHYHDTFDPDKGRGYLVRMMIHTTQYGLQLNEEYENGE